MSGDDLKAIQDILGHKHLTTTETYTHLLKEGPKRAVALIDRDRKNKSKSK